MCLVSEPKLQTLSGHFRVKTGRHLTWNPPKTRRGRVAVEQERRSLDHERRASEGGEGHIQRLHAELAHKEKIFEKLTAANYGNGSVILALDVEGVATTFTSYPLKGDVLVSGLRAESDLKKAADVFCQATGTRIRDEDEISTGILEHSGEDEVSFVDPWVTDSVWTGVVSCRSVRPGRKNDTMVRALSKYFRRTMSDRRVEVVFVRGSIPSVILRRDDLRGRVSVFSHGAYVITGVRDGFEAAKLREWLFEIMAQHWTETKRGCPCATAAFGPNARLCAEAESLLRIGCVSAPVVQEDTLLARKMGRAAVKANRQYLLSRISAGESERSLTAAERETLRKHFYQE